ncbi:hypothetical protein FBU30_002102 [Linnemannia zychae]|nr:hypothetical protein FBU30_002102 [Linnemannia zychae]
MALSVRNLMTQANRQQDPVLKYSGDNDNHITPQEYKIRVGTAIRTLREELPHFFENGLRTTSIYAPNIRLIEGSHTNMSLQGKLLYCWLAKAVRGSFKAWFRDIEFEIQSIRVNDRGGRGISGHDFGNYSNNSMSMNTLTELEQKSTTVMRQHGMDHNSGTCVEKEKKCDTTRYTKIDGINISRGTGGMNEGEEPSIPGTTVTVRWALKGTARSSLVLTTSGPTSPPPSSYSGLFVYEFNDRGLIDEHRIENIIPSPSSMAIRTITLLLSQSRPAATATFDDVSESRKRLGFD